MFVHRRRNPYTNSVARKTTNNNNFIRCFSSHHATSRVSGYEIGKIYFCYVNDEKYQKKSI